ncbi:hypothetical protein [Nocardioides sp. NPDC006303]|uniref:hypothetical protein n=1 Tax=Nocardioides sp. NPDC006303 TaxID=3156747 RepID=UPI0033BD9F8C
MNTINTRRTATTLAAAAAVAGALTIMSAVAPTTASAHRPDPAPRCAVSDDAAVGSSLASMDIDEIVTMLKVRRAMYLADHPSQDSDCYPGSAGCGEPDSSGGGSSSGGGDGH